jgi:pilus assembly protein CpaB
MRLRDIIGLILALILAVGVAFITRIFLTKEQKTVQHVVKPAPQDITKVLVAGRSLSPGDTIKIGDLVWRDWPRSAITPVDLTEGKAKIEEFTGSVVRFPIHKGNPIVREELVRRGEKGILAAVISPGKRAISIDVTASASDSGLIFPGDYVDVILSKIVSTDNVQAGKSQTILKNIKVLAFDTTLGAPAENPKVPPHVATLEMTPAEAEILMAGSKEGVITLSLHSMEPGTVETQQLAAETQHPVEKSDKSKKIILMRGKEKSEIEFKEK